MSTVSSPTPAPTAPRIPLAGILMRLLVLVAVAVGLVVMSPAAQGWGESVSTPHVHAAGDLHSAGDDHGVGDSRHAEPSGAAYVDGIRDLGGSLGDLLLDATTAAAVVVLLLAALSVALASWGRRAARPFGTAAAGLRPPLADASAWPPDPPTPAALSVFRI